MQENPNLKKEESFTRSTLEMAGLLLLIFLIRTFGFGLYQVPTGSMETTMLVGERFFADKFTPLFSPPKRGDIISFNAPTFPYSDNKLKRLWQQYAWGPDNWTKRVIGVPGDIIKGVIEDGKPVIYLNGKKLDEPYLNTYPLIGLYTVDPLKMHEIQRRQTAGLIGMGAPQDFAERAAAQTLGNYQESRSYDPSVSYENQPFYRMSAEQVIKFDGKPFLKYPQDAEPQQTTNIIRKGNNYWSRSDEFYVELGKNQYWVMGDNRRGSFDSRFFGPIDKELIHGKIRFRILSIQPPATKPDTNGSKLSQFVEWLGSFLLVDIILHPIDFWKRVRWNRCFQFVS